MRAEGFQGELKPEEPLAPYTTWRIGGPAELLATPASLEDLVAAVRFAERAGIPWRVLGNGSNLLVRDEGVRGVVLRLRKVLDEVRVEGNRVVAGAGASFPAVANLAVRAGLAGIEFGAGIPGTIGGAIVMNAGWHEHEIGRSVASVEVLLPSGELRTFGGKDCAFGYRKSAFRGQKLVVLSATLELEPAGAELPRRRLESFAEIRQRTQPTELPSCGSVFLKPDGDFAGRLIEQAGLKGFRIGDVEVSPKHANFFVNVGRASSRDVLALVEHVEREVERRFGIRLQREFEVW